VKGDLEEKRLSQRKDPHSGDLGEEISVSPSITRMVNFSTYHKGKRVMLGGKEGKHEA